MRLLLLLSIFSLAVLILLPVTDIIVWFASSVSGLLVLLYASGDKFVPILRRNIFILSFILFFNLFIFLSSYLGAFNTDTESAAITSLKILLLYNTIAGGMSLLGKGGLLFLAEKIRMPSLRLYMLLLTRSMSNLLKDHSLVVRQLKSRIDLRSRQKYLLPRYYTSNLVARELRRYGINQGVLLSRMPENYRIDFSHYQVSTKTISAVAFIIVLSFTGILMQRVNF